MSWVRLALAATLVLAGCTSPEGSEGIDPADGIGATSLGPSVIELPSGEAFAIIRLSGGTGDDEVSFEVDPPAPYRAAHAFRLEGDQAAWTMSFVGSGSPSPVRFGLDGGDHVIVFAVISDDPSTVTVASSYNSMVLATGAGSVSAYHLSSPLDEPRSPTGFSHGVRVGGEGVGGASPAWAGRLILASDHSGGNEQFTFASVAIVPYGGAGTIRSDWQRFGESDHDESYFASPAKIGQLIGTQTGSGGASLEVGIDGVSARPRIFFDHLTIPFDAKSLGFTVEPRYDAVGAVVSEGSVCLVPAKSGEAGAQCSGNV